MKPSPPKQPGSKALPFESPIEPDPLLWSPSKPKKPPRKEVRKNRKRLAELRFRAALEAHLPEGERRTPRLIQLADGIPRLVVGDLDEEATDPHASNRDYLALRKFYTTEFRAMARSLGADEIYKAKVEYEAEFQKAVDGSLTGIEAGDLSSL